MDKTKRGTCAVIFTSHRNSQDVEGYDKAAEAMAAEAARQPGYIGIDSVRDATGAGITISYWASEADAIAWRDHAEHSTVRAYGRDHWYDCYEVVVANVTRAYEWRR